MTTNPFAATGAGDPPAGVAPAVLRRTVAGLHRLAEQVLAAERYRAEGRIGLRPTPGGFGTPPFGVGDTTREVRVDGVELVCVVDGVEERAPVTTVGAAGTFLDLVPGAPPVYEAVTPLEPDLSLHLDLGAAAAVAGWLAVGAEALAAVAARHDVGAAVLWPEHFDLAVAVGECNLGISPGDDDHPVPYAYVGPWSPPPVGSDGGWWNQPYGRSVAATELAGPDDLVALYEEGLRRVEALHP
ncbi:MAG: hypothetical protein ACOYOP_05850 [Microthrixaceae bacterium]